MPAGKTHKLKLIGFKGHLYPADTEDYDYLKVRGVTTYRLPLSSLPVLKRTRLTKAAIEIVPFMDMWKPFMEHLEVECQKFGEPNLQTAHSILVKLESANVEKFKKYLAKVSLFTRRYCIAMTTLFKERESDKMSLAKVSFTYNEDINNSYAFMGKGMQHEAEDVFVEVPLAASLKLRICRSMVMKTPMLQVVVLDKMGEHWSEALNRSGKASDVSKQSLLEAAMFLLEMA